MTVRHLYLWLILSMIFFACQPERPSVLPEEEPCEFPVPEPVSRSLTEGGYDKTSTVRGEAGAGIDLAPYFKKIAGLEVGVSGQGEKVSHTYEKVIREFKEDNPSFTQIAWLHWSVACGLYKRVCADSTLTAKEAGRMKDDIIKEYKNELPTIERTSSTDDRASPVTPPPKTPPTEPDYLTSKASVQVAVLTTGDKSHRNFGDYLGNWLRTEEQLSVNTGLFSPAFIGRYGTKVRNRNISVFHEVGAGRVANCICWIDQDMKLKESTLAGESLITAILSARLTVFNLSKSTQATFPLNARGAGITVNRAMESLEEKLNVQFSSLYQTLSACR